MSDRFDSELKKTFKDSAVKSLEGWEFTPTMRQTVLKRIAEEAESPSPMSPRRSGPVTTRPFLWMAAAAAAFVVAINMMQFEGGFGNVARKSEAPRAASAKPESATSAQMATESTNAGGSTSNKPGGQVEKRAADTATNSAAQVETKAEVTSSAGQVKEESAGLAALAAPASPARIHLVVPEQPAGAPPIAAAKAPDGDKSMGIMAAPVEVLGMARTGRNAAVRTRESLQLVDADGGIIWEKPLMGGAGPLFVRDGKIATSAGSELFLFDVDGRQELKLTLPSTPEAIALSPDGRVAVLLGEVGQQMNLVVYESGKEQFRVKDLGGAFVAFGPDGALAVSGKGGLQLFSRDGARLWQAPLSGMGLGLTFAGGGEVIVAGGQAFHRSGQPLWEVPVRTQDLFTLGPSGPVVLWDSKQLTLIRPEDGVELWTAEHGGSQILRVASSDSGDQMAVLASVDETAAVWVLDQHGGLRYTERLPVQPSGVAVEGETLLLLMAHGVESRALPIR